MATRTTAEVRRYDIMKLIVTLILIAIIAVLLWRGGTSASPAPTVSPALAPTEAATATASPTATPLSPTATALPPTATPSPTPVTLPAPTLTLSDRQTTTAVLHGTGAPDSVVQIVANGEVLAEVTVAEDGAWMYTTDLTPGDYDLQAQAMNEAGEVVAASEVVAFTQPDATPTPPPAEKAEEAGDGAGEDQAEEDPTSTSSASRCGSGELPHGEDRGDSYVVAPCEYMALIAKRTGVSLEALITANPQVADPALIYPGQVLQLLTR